jgi:hypothetical protein
MQLAIAASESQFNEAPSLFQGFFERRLKRQVDLTVNGRLYTVTARGLLVSRKPLGDGKNWYSYLSSNEEIFPSRTEEEAWIKSLTTGRDHIGLTFK